MILQKKQILDIKIYMTIQKVEYKSTREKIIISSKTYGDLLQSFNDHLNRY